MTKRSQTVALAEYETPLNNGTNAVKKSPMFIMNRDGFTLLAMGFTGTKALQFKMEFLGAFNKMESLLNSDDYILMRSQQILPSPPTTKSISEWLPKS